MPRGRVSPPPPSISGNSPKKKKPTEKASVFLSLLKNLSAKKPRRVPPPPGGGIKSESVLSGDMCLGKDTSHDEWGDNFVRNRTPSVMQLFVEKDRRSFSTVLVQGLHGGDLSFDRFISLHRSPFCLKIGVFMRFFKLFRFHKLSSRFV